MIDFIKLHWELFVGLLLGISGISVYGLYTRSKDNLIKDIEKLIEYCKSCKSFDDKSEYKMTSWLELGKGELHRKSLFELRRVRKEMHRYFNIHLAMDWDKL